MKKTSIILGLTLLLTFGSAYAVPNLQLFIEGGTYDATSETWVIANSSFNLYVIAANIEASEIMEDVRVGMALGFEESFDPNGLVSVDVNGATYNSWSYGYAPFMTAPGFDPGDDLPKHGVFPAWYEELSAGDFVPVGGIGDVQPDPDYWDPSVEGYLAGAQAQGQYKVFSITAMGTSYLHFDAYTLNPDGSIQYFAPFSHDAALVPEPGTMILFGLGMFGLGVYRRFRR